MTKKEAVTEIGNRVYQAALLFEELEGKGHIEGNGHHMAQAIAEHAKLVMEQRFKEVKSDY